MLRIMKDMDCTEFSSHVVWKTAVDIESKGTYTILVLCLYKGFPLERSERALIETHNVGVEAAVNWLTAHEHVEEFEVSLTTV